MRSRRRRKRRKRSVSERNRIAQRAISFFLKAQKSTWREERSKFGARSWVKMRNMSSAPQRRLTEAEYLAIEREAETKSEFYDGEMFAMAGARRNHNLIVANIVGALNQQLREGPCEVYPGGMRVKVAKTGLYAYPDVV